MADTAKLFLNGGSQAVRLPKAYRFRGSAVSIRQEGNRVILEELPTNEDIESVWVRIDALGEGDEWTAPERYPSEDRKLDL